MKKILLLVVIVYQIGSLNQVAAKPVAITSVPFNYKQNFDALGLGNVNWSNDLTLAGWFIKRSNVILDDDFLIFASDGSIVQPQSQLYNFGSGADRALGALGSDSFSYGILFTNTSSTLINKVTVTYDGEQWRKSGDDVKSTIALYYRIDGTKLPASDVVGWTIVSNGLYTVKSTTPIGALNGNDAANRQKLTAEITDIAIAPGQAFWVRWLDKDDFGVDQGIAIDNVSVTFASDPAGFQMELKRPNFEKVISFRGKNGFRVKGKIRSGLTIERVEYAVAKPGIDNILLPYTTARRFKQYTKGRQFRKGYVAAFASRRRDNAAGRGTPKGTTSLTLVVKITGSTNNVLRTIYVPVPLKTKVR